MNSIMSLPEQQADRGVIAHSSGNHAGAVALAAKIRGIPAYIVLPTDAPQVYTPWQSVKKTLQGTHAESTNVSTKSMFPGRTVDGALSHCAVPRPPKRHPGSSDYMRRYPSSGKKTDAAEVQATG